MGDSDSEYDEDYVQSDSGSESSGSEESDDGEDGVISKPIINSQEIEKRLRKFYKGKLPNDVSRVFSDLSEILKVSIQDSKDATHEDATESTRNSTNTHTRKRHLSNDREESKKKLRTEDLDCKICHQTFSTRGYLRRHYNSQHKNETELKKKSDGVQQNSPTKKVNFDSPSKPPNNNRKAGNANQNINRNVKYDCKLCEASFNNVAARNSHYTGKHAVEDEKLLFDSDGTALVESTLEHHVRLKPDWFRAASKRNNISSRACKLCKVELDQDDLKRHYEKQHKVIQIARLKGLIRLSNSDIKEVADLHKCEHCHAEYDDISKLKSHQYGGCSNANKVRQCRFCNEKIHIKLYNNHIKNMHKNLYNLKAGTEDLKQARVLIARSEEIISEKQTQQKKHIERKSEPAPTPTTRTSFTPRSSADMLLYLCKSCDLATSSFDNVVKHCQDHILNVVNPTGSAFCDFCDFYFDIDYKTHMRIHENDDKIDRNSFKVSSYDYKCVMSDKWLDTFENITKTKVECILSSSIYFTTRFIRMKLDNDSKNVSRLYMLFRCVTCKKYVDPFSVEAHVRLQGTCINQLSSDTCTCDICEKEFYSEEARVQHDLTHQVANVVYATILFNKKDDWISNKILLDTVNAVQGQEKSKPSDDIRRERIVQTSVDGPILLTPKNLNAGAKDSRIETKNDQERDTSENVVTDSVKENQEKVANVYKCECGLYFSRLKFLFAHLRRCNLDTNNDKVTCRCNLVFDEQNYTDHIKVHREGFTKIKVTELTTRVGQNIDIREMSEECNNDRGETNENADEIDAQRSQCEETDTKKRGHTNTLLEEQECNGAIMQETIDEIQEPDKPLEDRSNLNPETSDLNVALDDSVNNENEPNSCNIFDVEKQREDLEIGAYSIEQELLKNLLSNDDLKSLKLQLKERFDQSMMRESSMAEEEKQRKWTELLEKYFPSLK